MGHTLTTCGKLSLSDYQSLDEEEFVRARPLAMKLGGALLVGLTYYFYAVFRSENFRYVAQIVMILFLWSKSENIFEQLNTREKN